MEYTRGKVKDTGVESKSKAFLKSQHMELNKQTKRPDPRVINPDKESFIFMQTDVDFDTITNTTDYNEDQIDDPILRMFGITAEGNSVCLLIENFYPYFYLLKPDNFGSKHLEQFKEHLNEIIVQTVQPKHKFPNIISIEVVEKIPIFKFQPNPLPFLKITVKNPKYMNCLRDKLEAQLKWNGMVFDDITYESKVNLALRFMIDRDIVGMSWIELEQGKYKMQNVKRITNCQYELRVDYRHITNLPVSGEYSKIAPIRVLSFDIECAAKHGHFPNASNDPVIQIANICTDFGNPEPTVQNIFCLKKTAEIPGVNVYSFETEEELLKQYRQFLIDYDPDIIIGYNISNFDFPYLINRASHLKVDDFCRISKINNNISKINYAANSAKSFGGREMASINIDGRIILDMYTYILKEHKLRSYTLNSVSFEFLGDQKEEVHHSQIYGLWASNEFTRMRLGIYCLKDAYLPIRLCEKLKTIYNYTEMCRVTCTPLKFILVRGQQIKVSSQLHRKARLETYVVPTIKRSRELLQNTFDGAYVLDPVKGFYEKPIVTLDFASLYPSIMMAHNLCYTTLLNPGDEKKMDPKDYTLTPNGDCFVKEHIRKGILPQILEELISARKKAKKELKEATDPNEKAVLDGRQLALKISANSVYGFTGATVGDLPCLNISASVTSFGREMIDKTVNIVINKFNVKNGYSFNSEVIYGDTDSVMIKFGVDSLAEAMELGKASSEYVTSHFKPPIKIEFEKVYFPYLLMKKKRYAGVIWTKLDKMDKIDTKGIENVRRDNCRLVKELVDNVVRMLLVDRDTKGAVNYCKEIISNLLQNKIDLSELIITKSLSKEAGEDEEGGEEEKKPEKKANDTKKDKVYNSKMAHVELAKKIKKRDGEGNAPGVGDRVAYVMVKGTKGSRNYENSEDPKFVLDNDLEIDTNYYLENQIKKPLERLFEQVLDNPNQELFSGEHTKIKHVGKVGGGVFSSFVTVNKTCLSCKVKITTGPLCKGCKHKIKEFYIERRIEVNNLQAMFNYLWKQCQRCQGSFYHEVICQNRDCPIYFKRFKVQKDLKECTETINRFEEKYEW